MPPFGGMIAAATVRPLRATDVDTLAGILARAYASDQRYSKSRLLAYLEMDRLATFIAECAGEPVGMVVGNDYGSVAYVSQMAVDPPLQRRGIATLLMNALVAWADCHGFEALELDATPPGAPLYARFGFVEVSQTVVYQSTSTAGDARAARRLTSADRAALFALDADAFGADRADVLAGAIASDAHVVVVVGSPDALDGYAIAQPAAQMLGPVVARDPGVAERLIDAARAFLPGPYRICVPSVTRAAVPLVTARGFTPARALAHMVRGRRPVAPTEMIYARINLGQG